MAVLSLRERLTDSQHAFDQARRSADSLIFVSPPVMQVGPSLPNHDLSCHDLEIELTVGRRWGNFLVSDTPQMIDVDERPIKVRPGGSIVVEAEQTLSIPNNVFGIVFPKSSLVHLSGLALMTTKIDPTYNGKPLILLWNLGSETKVLLPGAKLASVLFLSVDAVIDIHRPQQVPLPSGGNRAARRMTRNAFYNSPLFAGAVAAIISGFITLFPHLS